MTGDMKWVLLVLLLAVGGCRHGSSPVSAIPIDDLPLLVLTRDDTLVTKSCRIRIPEGTVIEDQGAPGVLQIQGRGLRVAFLPGSTLRGASRDRRPETLRGVGIEARGAPGLHLSGVRVQGFKVGLRIRECPEALIEDAAFDGLYRQRLGSTREREDPADWLYPHRNDENQWEKEHGAAVSVADSSGVTLRRIHVRNTQNGILLSRVNHSRIYDNDASFLSGWGLALWRSCDNLISRNAFDFCVRGYSHGVYNRGQDSAGVLLFEQSSRNVFVENSITHGGDGIFAFAGREALETGGRRGCNANLFSGNDLSYAAAHGLELTFSFDNRIVGNRLEGNAICGLWGGYSQETLIQDNTFSDNGGAGYGSERGAVNIEHGHANVIVRNRFRANRCGVHLWWDADEGLRDKPWVVENEKGSSNNVIAGNTFEGDDIAMHLVATTGTRVAANVMRDVRTPFAGDEESRPLPLEGPLPPAKTEVPEALGGNRPVGARPTLRGRKNIVMTPYGPWDHETPALVRVLERNAAHVLEALGWGSERRPPLRTEGAVTARLIPPAEQRPFWRVQIRADRQGVVPYTVELTSEGNSLRARGTLFLARWKVSIFPWKTDPRRDLQAWRREAAGPGTLALELDEVALEPAPGDAQGADSPAAMAAQAFRGDHFGTLASTKVRLEPGSWRVETLSDDGVRVIVDGRVLIENWTWHGPTRDEAVFTLEEPREVVIRVEHFELDGHATLMVRLERAKGR